MIEIIPNWHPLFVHFTVALFSTTVGFYVIAYLLQLKTTPHKIAFEWETTARWCLWIVALITIGTVLAGLYAYNTVKHDMVSHAAMTDHRNWALTTAAAILLVAAWSVWRYYQHKTLTITFIIALLITQGLLLSTAWRGAELVFRYGLGVLSLPQAEEVGHHHHSEGMSEPMTGTHNAMPMSATMVPSLKQSPSKSPSATAPASGEAHHHSENE